VGVSYSEGVGDPLVRGVSLPNDAVRDPAGNLGRRPGLLDGRGGHHEGAEGILAYITSWKDLAPVAHDGGGTQRSVGFHANCPP
jgi:hypothetical protein